MAKLIYGAITSLDGYIADEAGNFEWAAPDEEVHAFVNELERPNGTFLLGRRMYEVMTFWDAVDLSTEESAEMRDYAEIWRRADKIVYSSTLESVSAPRTRLERAFDPKAVRALKASSSRNISIGGPDLAAAAFAAGLVDEFWLVLHPILIGAGNPALPSHLRLPLDLIAERRFACGAVSLHYRIRPA